MRWDYVVASNVDFPHLHMDDQSLVSCPLRNRQWDIRGAESIRGDDEPIRTCLDVL